MSVPEVAQSYWKAHAGELLAGEIPVSEIADRFGTPLFIYDAGIAERKLSSLRQTLPASFSISYSVKANPNPAVLRFFLQRGCGLEIASSGEFHIAIIAGCVPERIVFAGPGKTEDELEFVIRQGIGEVHAESELELFRINAISTKIGVRTRVAVRVNPNEDGQGGAMRMGGKSAPFGIDEECLLPVLDRFEEYGNIEFCGIHLFVGTQILDAELLVMQYEKGLNIARRAAHHMRTTIKTLDFGGGLGIPYFTAERELDLKVVCSRMRELIQAAENEPCFAGTKFMVEPGRFLVGESGIYVARVNDIKVSRGKKYLILNGGMNHHLAASGNLGQVMKRNFPIAVLNRLDEDPTEAVEIVGPLCTPLDTLARSKRMPAAKVGDLIGIFQSGAYARTASPLDFLSHPTPPEVWVENGDAFLIRQRSSLNTTIKDTQSVGLQQAIV